MIKPKNFSLFLKGLQPQKDTLSPATINIIPNNLSLKL